MVFIVASTQLCTSFLRFDTQEPQYKYHLGWYVYHGNCLIYSRLTPSFSSTSSSSAPFTAQDHCWSFGSSVVWWEYLPSCIEWQRSVNVPKAMSYHECQLCRYWLCGSGVVIITPPMPPLTAVLVSRQLFGVPRNETRELSALVVPEVVIMTPAISPQKMYNSQKLCCHVHKLQQAEV